MKTSIGFFTEVKEKKLIIYSVLVGLALAVYSFSLGNDFVWDDYMVLVDNTFVHDSRNFTNLFNRNYLTNPVDLPRINTGQAGSGEGSYRPVNTFIHFLEFRLWRLTPFYYHLVNLLLHVGVVCLTYRFILMVTRQHFVSFATASLLAVSPAASEAVYVISFREDLLCALFCLLGLIAYVQASKNNSAKDYAFSLIYYLLAMFSKESAVVLPGIILAYEWCLTDRKAGLIKVLQKQAGYALLAVFYLWIRFKIMAPHQTFSAPFISESWGLNVLTMLKVLGIYFQWMLTGLGVHVTKADPFFINGDLLEPHVLIFLAVMSFWIGLCIRHKQAQVFRFGWVWFWLFMLPVLGLIPIFNIIAGRYLYVASIGFFLAAGLLMNQIRRLSIRAITLSVLLVFFSVLTVGRSYTFQNEITLRSEFLNKYPHLSLSYRSLSAAYAKIDQNYDRSIMVLQLGIEKFPDDMRLRMDIARDYRASKEYNKAIGHLKYILKFDKNHYFALEELCINYGLLRERANADACFQHALSLYPNDPSLLRNYNTLKEY